ncbi:MAG: DMT family transporter [Simkaniaceae bacterium]|nr:DMT family transporter [Simkaniaceae bacterium]
MRHESQPLAITYSLLAALSYASLALLIQTAEKFLPNAVLIFFRQFFGLLILLPMIPIKLGSFKEVKTKVFPLHMLRAFASLSSMFCLYFALRYLPLTDAVLLTYTRPLFIPIVVYLWFQQKWTKNTWSGLLVGFLGIILILRPDQEIFNIASLVGLAAGLFGAIAFTSIRRLTRTEPAERITFFYMALSLPLAAVPLANNWQTPTIYGWGFLALIGLFAVFYQLFLSRAYRHAKAFKVGSLLYSSVAFAYLFDFFLGRKEIPYTAVIGIILIVFGSIIALRDQPK